jgi:hypothetical protein
VGRLSFLTLFGALVIAFFTAGCGGGGDSAAPTKAEFIKRSDAICKKANRVEVAGLRALDASNGSRKSSPEEQLKVVILPAVRAEAEEIGALAPPQGEEERVNAIVAAYERALVEGEKDIASLLDGSSSKFEKAFKLAQAYGFKVCGVD